MKYILILIFISFSVAQTYGVIKKKNYRTTFTYEGIKYVLICAFSTDEKTKINNISNLLIIKESDLGADSSITVSFTNLGVPHIGLRSDKVIAPIQKGKLAYLVDENYELFALSEKAWYTEAKVSFDELNINRLKAYGLDLVRRM